MRTDPSIVVWCDAEHCFSDEEVNLTPLARGAWDERNVDAWLSSRGWRKVGGEDICPHHGEDI